MALLEEVNGGKTRRTQVQTVTRTGPGLKLVGTSAGAPSSFPEQELVSGRRVASVVSTAAFAVVVITAAVMFAHPGNQTSDLEPDVLGHR